MTDEPTVKTTVGPVDPGWLDQVSRWLNADDVSALTVLPRRVVNGKAVFGDDMGPLVKWLRSKGFDAHFLATPDQTFESHYGAVSDILLAVLVNIGSSAAWDSFKFFMYSIRNRLRDLKGTGAEPQCKMSLGLVKYPDGSSLMWQNISGPAEEVLNLAESVVRDYIAGKPDSEDEGRAGRCAASPEISE